MNSSSLFVRIIVLVSFSLLAKGVRQHALGQTSSEGMPHYEIGVVSDGPSWYFDGSLERALEELSALAKNQYTFSVRREYNAGYDAERVSEFLKAALSDPDIDMVYASGVIATERSAALSDDERLKPILGGALQFSDVRGSSISPEGTSQLSNYSFITSPRRVSADLRLLRDLTSEDEILVLVDELLIPELNLLPEAKASVEEYLGISVRIVPCSATARDSLARVPTGVGAAYVSILPRTPNEERSLLYEGLSKRGIVTVSMDGHRDVKLGALAGLAPDESQAVARRVALNMHQILQGLDTSLLPVYLPVFDRLLINNQSAALANWSPDYDTSLAAEFIGEQVGSSGQPIDLLKALEMGAEDNIDVAISRDDQAVEEFEVAIAKSRFRPKVDGLGSYVRQRTWDRINVGTTPEYFHEESLGVELTKILFNDSLWSTLKAQKLVAEAAALTTLSSELDAIGSAASSYFDYLSTRSLYEIERENLALTESNYQLAQLRIEIGAAEPVEVFRWEQERASARATLIQRESDRSNALVAFNLEIGAPREAVWDFEDIELADDDYYFLDNALEPLLTNTADFREFGRFAQLFAVDNSPELLAFDLQLASQGILLKESQRRFMPEISGFADYSRVFQGSSFLDTDSENQASVGIQLSLPVFEGGQRKAEAMQNQAVIRGLGAQREKAKQEIEQRALAAFFEIGAAHPNLRLSRQSLEAAEKNYESNQEKYSQGAASILDLLDAQESLLAQRQSAAVAVYDYLAAIHELQRSMAWFEYAKTAEEKGDLVDMLRRFIEFGESADMSRNDEYQKSARERAADALRESGSELLD